ncbi:hypothetical protein [Pseudomonas nitroreducens]
MKNTSLMLFLASPLAMATAMAVFMEVGYRDGDNFDQDHANVG